MHHLAIARHLILVTKILSQKGFVSTAGYGDEFDGEESDRDAGAQQNSNRDRDAKQTENMAADGKRFWEKGCKYPANYQKSCKWLRFNKEKF